MVKFTPVLGLDGRRDMSGHPISIPSARPVALLRKGPESIWRIVGREIYRWPLRILASRRRSTLSRGIAIPLAPGVDSDSFSLNYDFARACSEHIQKQSARHPWMAELDLEMLGIAFQEGSQWALRSQDNRRYSEVHHS